MRYRLHRKHRRYPRAGLAAASLGAMLVAGAAAGYADHQDSSLVNRPATVQHTVYTHRPTANTVTGKSTGSAHATSPVSSANAAPPQLAGLQTASCTMFPPKHPYLSNALTPELRKMAQYEQVCNGRLFNRSSFFVPTPATPDQAQAYAADVAARLKEYAQYGVMPLVFMEPTSNGTNLDLQHYAAGAYDAVLNSYYAALQANGVTDAMMGLWIILPEGNLPEWSSTDPTVYAAVVTRTAQLQKQYFPASHAGIMLDSESYPSAGSWDGGTYAGLLPYVQHIPHGLLDSFGMQGFPWAAPGGGETLYDPHTYLRLDLAEQAARNLCVQSLWVNTGTFHQMYANQSGKTVSLSPQQRQAMLRTVVQQMAAAQHDGFTVAIHLFAQNKADTSEGTDWSYWQLQPGNDADTSVFTTFVHQAADAGISLWLFDADN